MFAWSVQSWTKQTKPPEPGPQPRPDEVNERCVDRMVEVVGV